MSESHSALSTLGKPLVTARSSEIYLWQPQRVLKLFFPGACAESVNWERINTEEAFAKGATKICCYGSIEVEGRLGIIMNRLEGNALTRCADESPFNIFQMYRTLAELHVRMHQPHTERLQDIREIIVAYLRSERMDFLSAADKAAARQYILKLPAGNTLLHMDYHTDNILVAQDGATVIDWATAARGEVGADLAMTHYLFHEAELFPGITRRQAITYSLIRRLIYHGYRRHYKKLSNLSTKELQRKLQRWYLAILIFRLAAWGAPTEVQRLRLRISAGIARLPRAERAT